MAVFQIPQKSADEQSVPQTILTILGNSTRGTQNIFILPSLLGADSIMGKDGWNSQLLKESGGDKARMLGYLHEIVCNPQDYNATTCKAAAFFYGLNIDAADFNFNKEGVLKPLGKGFTVDKTKLQQVLREIYGFEDETVEQCARAVKLMFDAGFYSVKKKKEGFVLNNASPYGGYLSDNKDVLLGGSNISLNERQRFFFSTPQSPISLKSDVIIVPSNLNIPSGQYNFTDSYLKPYIGMIGGTIDQDNVNGKLVIDVPTPKLVSNFSERMTELTNYFLNQDIQTGPDSFTKMRDLIINGDPSAGGGSMLADGKSISDVETALQHGDVKEFLSCLKDDSVLRMAFGQGEVTSKEYSLTLGLPEIYAMQAKSYTATLGGYVPILRNTDLYIYGTNVNRIFITNNTRPDIWSDPQEKQSSISTTTGGARLIGSISNVTVSMKPRVIPKYLIGASVSKTRVDESLKDMIKASDWEFMFEAGGGMGFKIPMSKFSNKIKTSLELGADVLSSVSIGKQHDPNYNLQITPRLTFDLGGKANRSRFTVYSDVLMLEAQKGVSMQKSLPYSRTGVVVSHEFMMPTKIVKGVELNLDVNVNPFKGIEDAKVGDAFKNGFKDSNVQFGLIIRF